MSIQPTTIIRRATVNDFLSRARFFPGNRLNSLSITNVEETTLGINRLRSVQLLDVRERCTKMVGHSVSFSPLGD